MALENSIEVIPEKSGASLPLQPWLLEGARPYFALFLFTFLFWARTLSFGFVWDDYYFIEHLDSIRSLKNVPAMFTSLDAQSAYPQGFVLWRPLRTLHYAVLYALGGGGVPKAWLFHLANILWHGAGVVLLFSCARNLLRRFVASGQLLRADAVAFLLALGFSIHPVVTEVVCWAKSLDDLMATVFVLASLRALLADASARDRLWGAVGYFALAVHSKESAVPFAAVSFLVIWLIRRESFRVAVLQSAPFFVVGALFMLARHEVIGRTSQTAPLSGSYGQTLIDTLPATAKYLRLLWGIPPFSIDYSYMTGGYAWSNPQILVGLLLLIAGAAAIAWCLRRPRWRAVGFGLAWFALFMLPVSNLVPMMQYMAERFVYLPLAGWLIGVGAIVLYGPRARIAGVVAIAILSGWGLIAWERAGIWQNSVTLFVTSAVQGPRTSRMEDNAVAAILRLPHMQRVFQVRYVPGEIPRISLGKGAGSNTNWTDIAKTLDEASRLFPEHPSVNSAQGIVWALQGQPSRAVPYFQKVTEALPRDATAWANLGQALLESKHLDEARKALDRALELAPDNLSALQSLSSLLWQKEDYAAALPIFERLAKLDPQNPEHLRWANEARVKMEASKR